MKLLMAEIRFHNSNNNNNNNNNFFFFLWACSVYVDSAFLGGVVALNYVALNLW